jgi:hypothetical protein
MRIHKERGRRAQRLASTKTLAGTLLSAASSDPKSDSFSTHPQSGEGWVEKLYKDRATNLTASTNLGVRYQKVVSATKTKGVGQI